MTILSLLLCAVLADSLHYQYGQHLLPNSAREISFYVRIPTDRLQYILVEDSALFKYETRIIVYDQRKKQAGGDFWMIEKLSGVTNRPAGFVDTFHVQVPQAAASFRIRIKDFFGEEIYQVREELAPLGAVNSFLVYPSRLVEEDSVRLAYEITQDLGHPFDSLRIRLGIDRERYMSRKVPNTEKHYVDSLRFYLGPIVSGDYALYLDLFRGSAVAETRKVMLALRRSFLLEDGLYFEKVRQLRYIASEAEIGRLKDLPAAEREAGWNDFWKKKDENPNTELNETYETYFARINYAQEHFAHGDKGWESDRGMIYVKYGAPDDIEYHSFELHSEDYEIWYYYRLNLKFTFVDTYGQGRFMLVTKDGTRI